MSAPAANKRTRPKVLIVDDDESLRVFARAAVETSGLDCVEASNGAEALEEVERSNPSLIVLDMRMPIMDGLTACREIRKNPAYEHTPILMLTGLDDIESTRAAFDAGATDFVHKPINWQIFGQRVRYMMRAGRAIAALEHSRQTALVANRMKVEFMANMSHEIRTPMTAILGYLELLLEGGYSQARREEYIDTVHRSGQQLLGILDDILDISRLEAEAMTVASQPTRLGPLLQELTAVGRQLTSDKGLSFGTIYPAELPESITIDAGRLRQVITKLLDNAVKFTRSGSVKLAVAFDAGSEPQLRFEIADTGIGIDPADMPSLFEPFGQVDTSRTRRFGGTGLGLAISKRLIELMGGEIHVESTRGRGSVFTCTVPTGPLDRVAMVAPCAPDAEEASDKSTASLQLSGRILLAEDGVDNQRLIKRILERAGLEVTVAENGLLALEHAIWARDGGQPFDLILMDIQMPELDGLIATARLRQEGYTHPIVALTAHSQASDRQQCMEAGCDGYLTKPIDKAVLLRTIAEQLSKPRSD